MDVSSGLGAGWPAGLICAITHSPPASSARCYYEASAAATTFTIRAVNARPVMSLVEWWMCSSPQRRDGGTAQAVCARAGLSSRRFRWGDACRKGVAAGRDRCGARQRAMTTPRRWRWPLLHRLALEYTQRDRDELWAQQGHGGQRSRGAVHLWSGHEPLGWYWTSLLATTTTPTSPSCWREHRLWYGAYGQAQVRGGYPMTLHLAL